MHLGTKVLRIGTFHRHKDLITQRNASPDHLFFCCTENEMEYPSDIASIQQLYKEQVMKDTAMLSSLHIVSEILLKNFV